MISWCDDPGAVHGIIADGLSAKYGIPPTHTRDELGLLADRFTERIQVIGARLNGVLVAGAVRFRSANVDHIQYLASTVEGRRIRAQDALIVDLYDTAMERGAWLDMGVSTEGGGRVLNAPLMSFKEEFGGHAVAYDSYAISLPPAAVVSGEG